MTGSQRLTGFVTATLLACVPQLPRSVQPHGHSGAEPWPDVAAPNPPRRDSRRDAALIVSVEDYAHLPDRPGAHAVAGAWYRYLWHTRGLRPSRIYWLRDREASEQQLRKALQLAHWKVGKDATLWVVFVGHAATPAGTGYGMLLGPDATENEWRGGAPVRGLLTLAGHGMHRQLVAVLDGCLPEETGGASRSGLMAPGLPSLGPWIEPPAALNDPIRIKKLKEIAEETRVRVGRDMVQRGREPADAVVFTAGTGAACREHLPGADTPALSYLLLGGLRGWADASGDGRVSASEALRHADLLLRAGAHGTGETPRPQARGADVTLAYDARERGPTIAGVLPPDAAIDERAVVAEVGAAFVDDRMKKIDRGRFTLGCRSRRDGACETDERPARRIFLDSFAIDEHEVTWRDYAACVAAGGCEKVALARCEVWTGEAFVRGAPLAADFLGEDHPVVCATWAQAVAFCAWRGKRLPTEAEWERAARGPEDRHQYPWGDAPPTCQRAQTYECGPTTAPVGSHPAGLSPDGVHDLAGNASEWVADWYHSKAYAWNPGHNPAGPDRGEVRVVRGGSFYDGPGYLRVSYRYGLSPQWGYGMVGFRCAR
ncbi:formylglycine-generating enzyme family protein [Nannocystis radixulma]|uniref:SUMF1/EgtB/PvdO family nonheme iron enzyme n=1 Tax=Nannocystis radixulma TaxID=2995305 RepID=A0ABT5B2R3_9BACT|nr:SUMF1/EgtB/PvdO family nonheme iron enzyme [Nannocystis radixulma]MDC0667356.1 SUMF1/EgtB/PvdO family nonheme iron enzyme [Nannocystis radixulma]